MAGSQDKENRSSALPSIAGGILGGGTYVVMDVLLGVTFFWSLVAALGAFIAGSLIFQAPDRSKKRTFELYGVSQADLEKALREGGGKLADLKKSVYAIQDTDVRRKGEDIVAITDKILKDIENDPKDLRQARQFLNYYLDTTLKIVRRYVELSRQSVLGADARETLAKAESSLETVRKAFEKQLAKLMEDDVMDLDTEIEVLERTIKMEGLGDE